MPTYLITGGAANGKSTFAETVLMSLPAPRYYIAAMRRDGEDARRKIAKHVAARAGRGIITAECPTDVGETELPRDCSVMLECLCTLTANEMFGEDGAIRDVYNKILYDIAELESKCGSLIVVTNDVGSDGGGYGDGTMRYVETVGRLNAALAKWFDNVYEVVCGIPLALKGGNG